MPESSESDIACILHFDDRNGRRRLEKFRQLGVEQSDIPIQQRRQQIDREVQIHRKLNWGPGEFPAQHGNPKKESTAYYVGCGWSFWLSQEHPCLAGSDDSIHGSGSILDFRLPSLPKSTRSLRSNTTARRR